MRLSCTPVSFFDAISHGWMTLGEWLDFAVELKLDGVECGPLLIQPAGPAKPAEFRRMADTRGLAISNFSGYSDFTHPDPEVREREIAALLQSVRIARDIGSPSVRALTGQERPGVDQEEGITWAVEGIRRAAEEADRVGVRVNVENHTRAFPWVSFDFAMAGEIFLRVMEQLRDAPVGVQFDIANPLVAGEDTLALFEKVRFRIGYVHVNDVRQLGTFEFVPAGTGLAPIREVLTRLWKQGYDGWVGIEEASRTGKNGFRQAVQYTRQIIDEFADVSV